MEAGCENRPFADWRTLYEAAVIELDRKKMKERIAEAESAIKSRMEDAVRSGEDSESEALANALIVLRDLRKMSNEPQIDQ